MRKPLSALLVSVFIPLLLALPVVTPPAAEPRPVTPTVRTLPLGGVDATALRAPQPGMQRDGTRPSARPAILTPQRAVAPFRLLGVTWDRTTGDDGITVWVRTKAQGQDTWTPWYEMEADSDDAPDASSAEARGDARDGTAPIWAGASDAVQVRVDSVTGRVPTGMRVDLVDPGTSAADAAPGGRQPAATAAAAASQPSIYSRRQWGANESLRTSAPSYGSVIKAGFVHHTVSTNSYSTADVPAIIRGIYAFHVTGRGWSDIGYNFLVDRFGRTWEGRYGGIARHVIGAHTGGFNSESFGVSAIGDYTQVAPSSGTLNAISRVLAWKLGMYYANPLGRTSLYSYGSSNGRYPAGTTASFNVISGHRDASFTTCPGGLLYARMSTVRSLAKSYLGAGLVRPSVSASSRPYGSTAGIALAAGVLLSQSWQLDVRRACDNVLVRRYTGSATPTSGISLTWDLRAATGRPVPPGTYVLTLTSRTSTSTALPYRRSVSVVSSDAVPPVLAGEQGARVASTYVPLPMTRLVDTASGVGLPQGLGPRDRYDLKVTGVAGVPSTGVTAVALTVGTACPTATTAVYAFPAGAAGVGSTIGVKVGRYGKGRSTVVVPVGVDGRVSLANYAGETPVNVGIAGYYTTSATAARYTPMRPVRVYSSAASTPFAAGETRTVRVAGTNGVPTTATAVVASLVAYKGAAGATTFTAWAAGRTQPSVPLLDGLSGGRTTVARAIIPVGSGGAISVRNGASASHLNIEISGYYAPATGQRFVPVTPAVVADSGAGVGTPVGPWTAGETRLLQVTGVGGVPATARTAALLVTATGTTEDTAVVIGPAGTTLPGAVDLVPRRGLAASNIVIVPLSSLGQVAVRNTAGSVHLRASVVGWYA